MIHVVIGTKAQLIKMAPLMSLMHQRGIEYNYIFTGQHHEKISDIEDNFSLKKPDFNLSSHKDVTKTTQMAKWFILTLWYGYRNRKAAFRNDKHGIVLVHGDTVSTFLGALLAKLSSLRVGHVESGLRSFNLLHPFPEEITRLLVFRMTDYFFPPNQEAEDNLKKYKGTIVNTQINTLYDSLRVFQEKTKNSKNQKTYAIATLHRFENVFSEKKLIEIIEIIEIISQKIPIFFVLHKPTKEKLEKFNLLDRLSKNENIELHPRYDYFKFIELVISAKFIISDGGSNQEECYFLGKPILLLRNSTERPDGLGGNCLLSKYDRKKIDFFMNNINLFEKEKINIIATPCEKILKSIMKYTTHTSKKKMK